MVENGSQSNLFLTRFIGDKKSCVNGFHAGWTGETSHQPVINAICVISMHTGQVANAIPNDEFNHANDAPDENNKNGIRIIKSVECFSSYSRFFLHPSYDPVGRC